MPKKILYLITDLQIGGAEKQLFELVQGLDKTRFTPFVCGLKGWGKMAQKFKEAGFPVFICSMPDNPFYHPLAACLSLIKLVKLFIDIKPDVVHTFLFRANFVGRLVNRIAGARPLVSTVGVWDERTIPLFLERLTIGWANLITCNSQAISGYFQKATRCPGSVLRVVPNGVDASLFIEARSKREEIRGKLNIGPSQELILSAGRLDKQKGFSYLIEAFSRLVKTYPGVCLFIAGEGPLRKILEQEIARKRLDRSVRLLGLREDIPELMAASDIFVLPSLWEGSPNVILEAMASGLAIVATKVAGVPELIKEGAEGLLASPADSQALTVALERLLKDGRLRARLGQSALEKSKMFSLKTRACQFEKIYEDL